MNALATLATTQPDFTHAKYLQYTDAGRSTGVLGKVRDASQIGAVRLAVDPAARLFVPEHALMYVQPVDEIESLRGAVMGRIGYHVPIDRLGSDYADADAHLALRPKRVPDDAEIMQHPRMQALKRTLIGQDEENCTMLSALLTTLESASDQLHSFLWQNAREEGDADAATLIGAHDDEGDVEYAREAGFRVQADMIHAMGFRDRLTIYTEVLNSRVELTDVDRSRLESFVCVRALADEMMIALTLQPAATVAQEVRIVAQGDPIQGVDTLTRALYGACAYNLDSSRKLVYNIHNFDEEQKGADLRAPVAVQVGTKDVTDEPAKYGLAIMQRDRVTQALGAAPGNLDNVDPARYTLEVVVTNWDEAIKAFQADHGWVDWDVNQANANAICARYRALDAREAAACPHIADSNVLVAQLFQVYIAKIYLRSVEPDHLRQDHANHIRAGLVRGYGVLRGLVGKSAEVVHIPARDRGLEAPLVLQGDEWRVFIDELSSPNRVMVALATAVTSYLKSGHHSTANRLDNTLIKMLQSLRDGSELPSSDVAGYLGLAVHYGSHPMDMRLLVLYYRHLFVHGLVNAAIGRRLAPEGPGNVALVTGFRYLEELDRAGFFDAVDRKAEFSAVRATFIRWREESWKELPYASYLYGDSRMPDAAAREHIMSLFPLLSTMDEVMRNSTITTGIALRREAQAAAQNSLIGGLQVRAFARAFTQFMEGRVTARLQAAPRAQIGR